jgi:HEPN domain-containing protein
MARGSKTVAVPRRDAHVYLAKALEFTAEADAALAEERYDAAMLNAIHAGISAADAVAVALAGLRSSDPDHDRAADLLEEVAGSSSEIRTKVRQLRALLGKKNAVEYESRRASRKEATDTVSRARRFVDWSKETVVRANV